MLPPIGRREIHNTFFIYAGEPADVAPTGLPPGVGSRVESTLRESRRVESSRVRSSLERFAGRLRAFDPKCTVGAREVEEAEE